jgi:hypothetical protein
MLVTAMFILPYFPWFKNIKFYFVGFRALVLRMLLFLFRLLFLLPNPLQRHASYDTMHALRFLPPPEARPPQALYIFSFSFFSLSQPRFSVTQVTTQ